MHTTTTTTYLVIALTAWAALACDTAEEPTDEVPTGERCLIWEPPPAPGGVKLERVFDHAFPDPSDLERITQLVPSPFEAGVWYAVKHKGWILRFSEDPGVPGHETVLDMRDGRVFTDNDEAGVMSLTFHPSGDYAFLMYSAPPAADGFIFDSRIARYDVTEDGRLDPDSEVVFLELPQPVFPHSGNQVLFGPDGYLYATFGDSGYAGDANRHGQNPATLYGTVIRIDVDRADEARGTPYSIPPDNPFAGGVLGAPEVFAYGLRNTWRMSFDSETGALWGGDVGENRFEEINRIELGGNYGWSVLEGQDCYRDEGCDTEGLIPPILDYDRSEGISVTGGYVYRGGDVPSLEGRYVFADYLSGTIWSVDAEAEPGQGEKRVEVQAGFWLVSFAESPDGELYVTRWSQAEHYDKTGDGGIYRIAPDADSGAGDFPERLSLTGCMREDDLREARSGLIPYDVHARLWSDGASKERYISLPEDATISVDPDGDFVFPEGTVLVKSFLFEGRLHETRLMIHHEDGAGWRGYTYRWNAEQTEADLLEAGANEVLHNGTFWRYPSRAQCMQCHTTAAGFSLGLEAGQLDIDALLDAGARFDEGVTPEQLEAFVNLPSPHDPDSGSLEERARAYLHSNCAGCHRPGGPTRANFDVRYTTPLADTGLCDVDPDFGTLGLDPAGMKLLAPGDPDASLLRLRMLDPGDHRMPPLGTELVDADATTLIADWITSIQACP